MTCIHDVDRHGICVNCGGIVGRVSTVDWHQDPANVLQLATWLNSESYFESTDAMLSFFEKPWKWGREWELCLAASATDDRELKEAFFVAVMEGETVEEATVAWFNAPCN